MDFALLTVVLADFIAPLVLCGCAVVFTFFYVKRYYADSAQAVRWDKQYADLIAESLKEPEYFTAEPKLKKHRK